MSEVHLTHEHYLTPASDTFWRWTSRDGIVEWKDGTTIAFRDELATVLAPLATGGLPPFDMVVLVLAACRDSWKRFDAEVDLLIRGVEVLYRLRESGPLLHPIIEGLDRLHRLPQAMREIPERKAELLSFVFERYPYRMSRSDSTAMITLLGGTIPEAMLGPAETTKTIRQWGLELRGLLEGLQRIDEERIRLWSEIGLEQTIEPAPLPDVDGEAARTGKPRDVLDELSRDPQHRGMAQLARHLKAVVTLPRPIADRDELPLGGVSDIANRGPLDRLILSELANDDDVLMVRVALNEALYLRRERPPDTPPRHRCLLIDSGLRMWGVPRLFATAVALALGAHPDRRTRALRAHGSAVSSVDLATREGVVAHLAVLEPHAHPGDALVPFAQSLGEEDHDVVIVTGADVHDDHEFRRQLADCGLERVLLALVDRSGEFRLIERSPRGEHTLLEATLKLDQLLERVKKPEAAPPAPVYDPRADRDLPAIMRLKEFPLRLSHAIESTESFCTRNNDGDTKAFVSLTRDRRLMFWDREDAGGRQLSDEVPAGSLVAWDAPMHSQQPIRCVVRSSDWRRLCVLTVEPESGDIEIVEIPTGRVTQECNVWIREEAVFHDAKGQRRIHAYCCRTGRSLAMASFLNSYVTHTQRFMLSGSTWRALSWDGAQLSWEFVMDGDDALRTVAMFDCPMLGGPVAVQNTGDLFKPATGERLQINHGLTPPVFLAGVTCDGSRFGLIESKTDHPNGCLVHIPGLNTHPIKLPADAYWYRYSGLPRQSSLKPLRHQISSIGVHKDELVLFAKGTPLALRFDAFGDRLQLIADRSIRRPVSNEMAFGRPWKLPKRGYRLRRVVWPDGSRAILDSRGLLHLKSSNAKLPEFTLVLHDENVAGWSNTGRMWGLPYFLGDAPASPVSVPLHTVIKPFLATLP